GSERRRRCGCVRVSTVRGSHPHDPEACARVRPSECEMGWRGLATGYGTLATHKVADSTPVTRSEEFRGVWLTRYSNGARPPRRSARGDGGTCGTKPQSRARPRPCLRTAARGGAPPACRAVRKSFGS